VHSAVCSQPQNDADMGTAHRYPRVTSGGAPSLRASRGRRAIQRWSAR
jgi:hypothetical protein